MSSSPEGHIDTAGGSTSASLLSGARRREEGAWERLVGVYAPLVVRWCRGAGLDDADAGDVSQEVFRSVLRSLGDFRREGPGQSFRAWLRVITRSRVVDHHRRRKGEPRAVGGSTHQGRMGEHAEPAAARSDERSERAVVLRGILGQLRPAFQERTWAAFWRTCVDGARAVDIAEELGMTPVAVRVAKSRVLRRLREEMGVAGELRAPSSG